MGFRQRTLDTTNVSDATTLEGSFIGARGGGAVDRSYLIVREGERTRVIDLDDGANVVVGRSSSCTVQLDDGKASREHARFVRRGDVVEVVDLGSRNGTHVNGDLLAQATRPLRSGDVVRIGKVEMLVAETAAMTTARAGSRVDAELARLLAEGGSAALVEVAASGSDAASMAPLFARAAVVEHAPGDRYVCLVESAALADALVAEVKRAAPRATAKVAHAPAHGRDVEALLAHAHRSDEATRRALPDLPGVVVADPAMVRVFELVRKVAASSMTVLVLGETGAGKEVIAEQIHRLSARAGGPFLRVNCGSLPETLIESELFGHEKGAFTGADRRKLGFVEAAHGGTLFLDEIGELTSSAQTRLLRVLEDRRFTRVGGRDELVADVRVVAATNRDLEQEAKAGRFRQDLYFRLSAFVIRVPPLRERAAELELLAQLFLRQFARRMDKPVPAIAASAMERMRRYAWPGNVRELRNAIEHAVVLADRGTIDIDALPEALRRDDAAPSIAAGPVRDELAELERRRIQEALDAESGNQTRAAKRLGISRRALQYKMEKYDLKS